MRGGLRAGGTGSGQQRREEDAGVDPRHVSRNKKCSVCGEGQSAGTGTDLGTCSACDLGFYQEQESHLSACVECGSNAITRFTGATTEAECVCGYGRETVSAEECVECPSGKYSTYGLQRMECSDGSIAPQAGSSVCELCVPGKHSVNGKVCYECQPG